MGCVAAAVFTSFLEETPELTNPPKTQDRQANEAASQGTLEVQSPFEGSLVQISVQVGERVTAGQTVAVVSAMKLDTGTVSTGCRLSIIHWCCQISDARWMVKCSRSLQKRGRR